MRQLALALVALFLLRADMYPDASNAKLPEARAHLINTPSVCDGKYGVDAAMTSGSATLTSATGGFTAADANKMVTVGGAGTTQHYGFSTVAGGGAGYLPGQTYALAGGTSTTPAVVKILATNAGAITEAAVYTPGSYSAPPANPVALAAGAGGTGATLTVTWDRDALVTTIASVGSATTASLSAPAGATVTGKTYGSGSDYAAEINAAVLAGVALPKGYCGVASKITLPSNSSLLGQGSGQNTVVRTELLWLGAPGGTVVSTDTGAPITAVQAGYFDINGLCSAARGIEVHNVVNSTFWPLRSSRSTAVQIHVDTNVDPITHVQLNHHYKWYAQAGACGSGYDQGMVWGPGTVSTDISQTFWYGTRITSVNGTGFECGNSDSNQFHGFYNAATGVGRAMDMLGGAAVNTTCRDNQFWGPEAQGNITFRGTDAGYAAPNIRNSFFGLVTSSHTPTRTYGAGTLFYCYNEFWSQNCGNTAVQGTELPANPTGTTSLTDVMMGLGVVVTPKSSGKVLLTLTGNVGNTTVGSGARIGLRTGSGAPPVNGVAVTGGACGARVTFASASVVNGTVPFSLTCIGAFTVFADTWVDVQMDAVTGGTTLLSNLAMTYAELP